MRKEIHSYEQWTRIFCDFSQQQSVQKNEVTFIIQFSWIWHIYLDDDDDDDDDDDGDLRALLLLCQFK